MISKATKIFAFAGGLSLILHLLGFGIMDSATRSSGYQSSNPVKIKIVKQTDPAQEPPKPEPVKPPPPKPKPPKPKKPPTERVKPQAQPAEPPKPIMGLDPSAVSPDGKGISVPVGNTLLIPDDGKRVKPEDVKPFTGDLSSDPKLIRGSIRRAAYTDAAVEAGLQGKYIVDVYVAENGAVTSAELRKKIGYGMDERVLEVARAAKYLPRRNEKGISEAAWTELPFTLQLP